MEGIDYERLAEAILRRQASAASSQEFESLTPPTRTLDSTSGKTWKDADLGWLPFPGDRRELLESNTLLQQFHKEVEGSTCEKPF